MSVCSVEGCENGTWDGHPRCVGHGEHEPDDETEPKTTDMVNKPSHYHDIGLEPIDAIDAWQLGFNLGNTVKYVARAAHKGTELQDLQKARWYLDREIKGLGGS